MENKDSRNYKSEDQDVDFEPLIAWFLGIFKSLSNFFSLIYKSIINQYKLIISFSIIGLIIGLGVFFFAEKKYSASVQLVINHSSNLVAHNMISSLTKLANDKSYNNLKVLLDIPEEQSSQISAILYLDHNYLPVASEDTIVERKPFFIYLETLSPDILVDLQVALINYLENQPLTSEYRDQDRYEITSKIEKHEVELKRLDSLKAIVAQSIEPRSSGNGFIYGEPINPVDIYQESERIFDDYLRLKSRLKTLKSVKTISKFMPSEKPIFPRMRHVLLCIGIFFFLGLIVAARKEMKVQKKNLA